MVEMIAKPTGTPTPNPNPYGNQLMKATIVPPSSDVATPATLSTATSASIIAANQQKSMNHNSLVNHQSGRGGGHKRTKSKRTKSKRPKSKRTKSKRTKRSKRSRSKRSKRSKRPKSKSKRSKRSKRGGLTTSLTPSALIANVVNANAKATPTPTPISVTTVPQFSGANSASANVASVKLNHGGMTASTQATYDNTDAAPSNFRVV